MQLVQGESTRPGHAHACFRGAEGSCSTRPSHYARPVPLSCCRWPWTIGNSAPPTHLNVGVGVRCSWSCRRLVARGGWTSWILSVWRLPHTWLEETTTARTPGGQRTAGGCVAVKG